MKETALSSSTQAVLDATGRKIWYRNDDIAAALRAAAEKIEDLYCDSDIDSSDGVVFAMRQLMIMATELESASA